MTDDFTDDPRRQVQDRIYRERAQLPPARDPDAPPEITSQFIRECLFANELGDGTLYAALFRHKFVFCKNTEEWYEWVGHHWQRDILNHSLVAVEEVVDQYLLEYSRVGQEIAALVSAGEDAKSQKILRVKDLHESLLKRASQLRGGRRRTSCLKFAHTIDGDALAITGEEFDNKPMLFPCANGVIDLETGKLKPGRPGNYMTKASPIAFTGIDAPCDLWEKTLLEIFDGCQPLVDYNLPERKWSGKRTSKQGSVLKPTA